MRNLTPEELQLARGWRDWMSRSRGPWKRTAELRKRGGGVIVSLERIAPVPCTQVLVKALFAVRLLPRPARRDLLWIRVDGPVSLFPLVVPLEHLQHS